MAAPISTTYTPEERAAIAQRVIAGCAAGRSVAAMLREDGMPAPSAFWRWHFEDTTLQDDLARARALGVEALLDEARVIADGDDVDLAAAKPGAEFAAAMTKADARRAKLRVDTRIKMAQMLAPRKYGPKLDVTTDGAKLNDHAKPVAERVTQLLDAVASRVGTKVGDALPVLVDARTLDMLD